MISRKKLNQEVVRSQKKQSRTQYRRNRNFQSESQHQRSANETSFTRPSPSPPSFIEMTEAAATGPSPAKRSTPPPPADLSKPNAGQPPAKRARDNKFDPTVLPPTSDADEILKQVEFYFSDANLPRDKFLWNLTQTDPKGEGWVPIKQIASFKRMQRFRPVESIATALRGSKDLLQVNEDGTAVRRTVALIKPTDAKWTEINNRTLYVVLPFATELTEQKGFGDETPTLQIDLETFFRGFGDVDSLRLRRTDTGLFKGSVLVQFRVKEDAEKFLAEPQEWNGSLLEAKTKLDWLQIKKDEEEKLTFEERRIRDQKRDHERRNQKRFSAFKELERQKSHKPKDSRDGRKGKDNRKGQGRRGRDNEPRDRSSSPRRRVESPAEPGTDKKRPREATPEEAPSLFSNKREKLEEPKGVKRGADEELNGETKKVKPLEH
jgi:lupus La protein